MSYTEQVEALERSLREPQQMTDEEMLLPLSLAIESGDRMKRCLIALLRHGLDSKLEYVVRSLNMDLCYAQAELNKLKGRLHDSTAAAGTTAG